MARSRSSWLLLPVGFVIAYVPTVWALWLPLRRAWIVPHKGDASFISYWEGEVFGYVVIQILSSVLLALICALPVPTRRRDAVTIGGLTGLATAVLDRFITGASFFGSPVAVGGIIVALFLSLRSVKNRSTHSAGSIVGPSS
jgi:hypothetical protein